jgi:late competence protein required for DNA uptake (superfamily II DNA/RNA helicase)
MEHSLVGTEVRTGSAKLFSHVQGQHKYKLMSDKAIMAQYCRPRVLIEDTGADALLYRPKNMYQFHNSGCLQWTGHRADDFAIRG